MKPTSLETACYFSTFRLDFLSSTTRFTHSTLLQLPCINLLSVPCHCILQSSFPSTHLPVLILSIEQPTKMTTTPNNPPTSTLLIYPATILLGSLFSILSPTARSPNSSNHNHHDPFIPSLASDINLPRPPPTPSPEPVNYFARKNNIFNTYFVKVGWAWTTLAFIVLLLSHTPYLTPASQRARKLLQAGSRYALATTSWYLTTQWFFGPAIIDRGFVVTGGKCEGIAHGQGQGPKGGDTHGHGASYARVEELVTSAACKAAGGEWSGGHDVSGHVFMLVLATAVLGFEVLGARAVAAAAGGEGEGGKSKEPEPGEEEGWTVWAGRFVWGVVGLGWWMLFMTAIWFHTWLEKVSFSASGLV